MKPFTEALRFDYPLTDESRVLDVGGYEGNWAYEIIRRYRCQVVVLEPINEFYAKCIARLSGMTAKILPFGMAAQNCVKTLRIHGDMSGEFSDGREERCTCISPEEVMSGTGWDAIDLVKLNCEGAEFEILEHCISTGLIKSWKNLQVQFHGCAPNAAQRLEAIKAELSKTHECEYDEPWIWSGWRLK